MKRTLTCGLLVCLCLFSCRDKEVKSSGSVDSDRLFLDYTIWAEEEKENVTCRFQFKLDDAEGEALRIDPPGRVELDGRPVPADSTKFMGFYYELNIPVDSFAGRHTILFTGTDGKQVKQEFEFQPFALAEELPQPVERAAFTIRLSGLPNRQTPLRLLLLDTSLATEDVNDMVGVANGQLQVEPAMLDRVADGPINLEISREDEFPITNRPGKGRMAISYVVRRELELKH